MFMDHGPQQTIAGVLSNNCSSFLNVLQKLWSYFSVQYKIGGYNAKRLYQYYSQYEGLKPHFMLEAKYSYCFLLLLSSEATIDIVVDKN